MWLHPNGTAILGENNIGFMNGTDHKALRKSFLNLFTRRALSTYLNIQERLIREHISRWIKDGKRDVEMRFLARDLNLMTSQTVFVGPYLEAPESKGGPLPHYASNFEMACVVMDFLFDASTASLTQTVALLADHPDVLERVRKEQELLNPEGRTLTYELTEKMTYTRQVMKEILCHRPPAPMVIQKAMRDIKLTDDYVCPKGAIVCPSITAACLEGFSEPEKFDPDRMGPECREDVQHFENFLVFGVGPHMCVGKEYAMNHLTAFISVLATTSSWTRTYTSKSHQILYLPTIYPADCLVTFKAKEN